MLNAGLKRLCSKCLHFQIEIHNRKMDISVLILCYLDGFVVRGRGCPVPRHMHLGFTSLLADLLSCGNSDYSVRVYADTKYIALKGGSTLQYEVLDENSTIFFGSGSGI